MQRVHAVLSQVLSAQPYRRGCRSLLRSATTWPDCLLSNEVSIVFIYENWLALKNLLDSAIDLILSPDEHTSKVGKVLSY
jgi:hypothetical protein